MVGVGPVTFSINDEVRQVGRGAVTVVKNGCLFATRIDLLVYDPGRGFYRAIRGVPSLWNPVSPDNESCLPLGVVVVPSKWQRLLAWIRSSLWSL